MRRDLNRPGSPRFIVFRRLPGHVWRTWAVLCLLASGTLAVQGDTCGEPFVLNGALPMTLIGTTSGMANDYDAVNGSGCPLSQGGDGPDVVYALRPSANYVDVTFSLCQSATLDTTLYLRSSCDAASSQVACDEDSCGGNTDWRSVLAGQTLVAGETTYVVVDGFGTSEGFYQLAISGTEVVAPPTPIPGDGCASPLTMGPPPQSFVLDTAPFHNTFDMISGSGCLFGAGGNSQDIVFRFLADANYCLLDLSLCETATLAGAHPDPDLYVRADCLDPASQIACSEDACNGTYPRLTWSGTRRGDERYFVVDGYGNLNGMVRVELAGLVSHGATGDDCCTPVLVDLPRLSQPHSWIGTTTGLHDDFTSLSGAGAGASDAVYEITSPQDICSVTVELRPRGLPWRPAVSVWRRGCLAPEELASAVAASTGSPAVAGLVALPANEPITVIADGALAGEQGDFQLILTGYTQSPSGSCANPEAIPLGAPDLFWSSGPRTVRCDINLTTTSCGASGRAHVFTFQLPEPSYGTRFSLDPALTDAGVAIELRDGCLGGTALGCARVTASNVPAEFEIPLLGGQSYSLFVTGSGLAERYQVSAEARFVTPTPTPWPGNPSIECQESTVISGPSVVQLLGFCAEVRFGPLDSGEPATIDASFFDVVPPPATDHDPLFIKGLWYFSNDRPVRVRDLRFFLSGRQLNIVLPAEARIFQYRSGLWWEVQSLLDPTGASIISTGGAVEIEGWFAVGSHHPTGHPTPFGWPAAAALAVSLSAIVLLAMRSGKHAAVAPPPVSP